MAEWLVHVDEMYYPYAKLVEAETGEEAIAKVSPNTAAYAYKREDAVVQLDVNDWEPWDS